MSETGTVKKWMDGKGFGFITPADGGEDVFVHVKQVSGGEDLSEGDQVTFDKAWNDQKGRHAPSPSSWWCWAPPMAETAGSNNKQSSSTELAVSQMPLRGKSSKIGEGSFYGQKVHFLFTRVLPMAIVGGLRVSD